MLTRGSTAGGLRVAAIVALSAAALLVLPATAMADLRIKITDPVKDVVDQTTDIVVETTTDLVDTTTSGSLPSPSQLIAEVTTQVAQATNQLVDVAGDALGSSGSPSGPSESEGPATAAGQGSGSGARPSSKDATAATSSSRAARESAYAGGSGVVVTVGRSAFTKGHAPPPPRYRAPGAVLAQTGLDVAVPLAVLLLLATVGISSRVAERRRSGQALGERRYVGKHRAPPQRRLSLSPVPA
jgi:hypothetical protein